MSSKDISTVGIAIVTLVSILLFLIFDHPIFIVPITFGLGVIGYISLRKESKEVISYNK